MNKTELINRAAESCGLRKKDAERFTETLLSLMKDTLAAGERVTLTNFGTFEVRQREARVGRNPKTGQAVEIPPVKTPVFRPCASLKSYVEEKGENHAS